MKRIKFDKSTFKKHLKNKIGKDSLRFAGKVSGISAATLSRISNGTKPDVDTFGRLCIWMDTNANDYFK